MKSKCKGCRLCLEIIEDRNFVTLEEDHKDMLQILIPVINWSDAIYGQPKMCQKCSENLQTTSSFKISCLDNNKKENVLEELSEMFDETEKTSQTCCLCCQGSVFEESLGGVNMILKQMVHRCFPQLSLPSSDNLGICEKCLNSLKDLDSFINNCLKTEEYVKNYCSTVGISLKNFKVGEYINHKNPPTTSTDNGIEAGDAVLNSTSEETGTTALESNSNSDHAQEPNGMDISHGEEDVQQKPSDKENAIEQTKLADSSSDQRSKSENDSQFRGKFHCDKCDYSSKFKSCLISHMVKHKDPSKIKMHKCDVCGHETKRIADLRWHMIIHKDPAEVKLYYCADCSYKTKRKADLKQHVVIHKPPVFKCTLCTYETHMEKYLNTVHMLIHKDKSEVKMYKCKSCPYETRIKARLSQHSRVHKELEKFKCNWCSFETKYKQCLKDHQALHEPKSERKKAYKCNSCDYETSKKSHLIEHMVRHTTSTVTYDCTLCSYKGKLQRYLKIHMNKHKDPSEIRMFKCEFCTYEVNRKGNLKSHLYTHIKNLSDSVNKQEAVKIMMSKIDNITKL